MLIKFRSDAGPSVLMFGEIAHTLLRMMGMSGDVPGALVAADVPAALEKLKHALANEKTRPQPTAGGEKEDGKEPPVAIAVRAFSLVQLLEASVKGECDVMWDTDRPLF